MDRIIEFKNFVQKISTISTDLYLDNEFIVTMTDNIAHVLENCNTNIGLYDYFRHAVLAYISCNDDCYDKYIVCASSTNQKIT